jgi:hypothetical protein
MQYCPQCNNIMDIGKNPPRIEPTNIEMNKNEQLTLSSDTKSEKKVNKLNKKRQIKREEKEEIKIDDINSAYRICKNCSYFEKLNKRTIVFTRANMSAGTNENLDKYKYMIYDKTLPHTRDYICKNKLCVSHKDDIQRDAVWFRPNQQYYNTIYACCACNTLWNIS